MSESNQIFRIDGRNVFLEELNSTFEIGKVLMNFIEYDVRKDKGERIKQEIPFYVDIAKFLLVANDTLSGRNNVKATKEREDKLKRGSKYCNEIWNEIGGIPSELLKKRGKERADGKSLFRKIKLTPGDKVPWVLSVETGPGELTETGLIVQRYTENRPDEVIRVPMTNEDLKRLVLIVKAHIEGYIASQYQAR